MSDILEKIIATKRDEIKARRAELEHSEKIDKAAAMKEAVRLNKMLDQLKKYTRTNLPQWKVTGI